MTLSTTIAVLLVIPVMVWAANQKLLSSKLKNVSMSGISAVLLYVFILVSVAYIEHKLNSDLAAFDLDGDGFFSDSEVTPEQEKAMSRVTADTGRTFAPFIGAIFAAIYFLVVWLVSSIISWANKWRASRNT
ncbi:hypothetical protein [Veronia pacifica]|uniref:Uncharacterized protein n=1 Tax=Veronia pacifica TaxID=1080227 RepID=A0A1C3EJA5_9GAMM|nr:hypothetical protein [Veronia pacifica]ODA33308.1 hypothetical protein A8L45_10960 [Veronia pacifica]